MLQEMEIFWELEKWLMMTLARSPLETHRSYRAKKLTKTRLALDPTLTMLTHEMAM